MRLVLGGGLVWLVTALTLGQSLGELAKREKIRRERNRKQGVKVIELTQAQIQQAQPSAESTTPETVSWEEPVPETTSSETESEPTSVSTPTASVSTPTASSPAPAFTLEDRHGRRVSLVQLRGRPVLLDFWATWCGPCRATMPEVERLHRKYQGQGLQVVGINIEGKSQEVLSYWDGSGYSFMVLFDSNNWQSETVKQYQVSAIPHTFLIDRNGNIVYSGHPGGLSEPLIEMTLN